MIVRFMDNIAHSCSKLALLSFFAFICTITVAQTNISGVINTYVDVTAITIGTNSVTVSSSAGLTIGDRMILMQMKGAVIDEFDGAAYGTITSYADAGNYEIVFICDIQSNEITFDFALMNTYTASGVVQLINFPTYSDATITGADLTAAPWDGLTGGVLAFEVTGTLDFGTQDINVNDLGFRGPISPLAGGGCNFNLDVTYYQPSTDPDTQGFKGEGIRDLIAGKETGRGPLANGGGGGNNHNGGGGGGGNYGAGGRGGERIKRSFFTCGSVVGVDAKSLSAGYAANKIFLAGGGGSGHGNNGINAFGTGENGAGIVIIKAGTVTGNSRSIFADGTTVPGNADSDGGGGAGAGGTVFLDIGAYTNVLNVSVTGGDGASTDNFGTSNCNGPGGGGGGGIVWVSGGAASPNLIATLTGGAAGIIAVTGQTNCTPGSNNGATPGGSGAVVTSLILNESGTPYIGCVLALPVEFLDFTHHYNEQYGVKLMWSTASEQDNDYYTVYRSVNGENFNEISTVDGAGNSSELHHYSMTDPFPEIGINY
ncbi:MAG: hypothetical protein ACI837_003320, partial [Crocinitomicaceae bacterium]